MLNVPVATVAIVAFAIACPSKVRGQELSQQKLSKLDWPGCFLMLVFSTLLVFGLQEGAIGAFPWRSAAVASTLSLAAASGCLLVLWQFVAARLYEDLALLLPVRIIKDRVLLAGILSTLATGFSHELVLFNLPLRFQIVDLNSPQQAGIHTLPFLGAVAVGATLSGAASTKNNYTFYTFVLASACVVIGDGLFTTLNSDFAIILRTYGASAILGFGTGMTMASATLMGNDLTDTNELIHGADLRYLNS